MSSSSPEPSDDIPDHGGLVPDEVHDLIRRAHWQSAKSVEDVAPHQYVVIGWNKDDLTDDEFWFFVRTIKELGRLEECRSHVRDRGIGRNYGIARPRLHAVAALARWNPCASSR